LLLLLLLLSINRDFSGFEAEKWSSGFMELYLFMMTFAIGCTIYVSIVGILVCAAYHRSASWDSKLAGWPLADVKKNASYNRVVDALNELLGSTVDIRGSEESVRARYQAAGELPADVEYLVQLPLSHTIFTRMSDKSTSPLVSATNASMQERKRGALTFA
jgi:hypothetical protein